ncbi:hypothetical protein [Microcoleus sp. CAWBG58]|uniref:hypothetical protein n=1 Tax=Microcoleus sp. CAWBG58 TaxID=2841651 RepID=UPI0025EE545F|nr:hypothetical protein [Microcoleus sp. CAWBG58]
MNLTSTLLKIDLAVLAIVLGVLGTVVKYLREMQDEAVKSAEERTEIRRDVEFFGKRLDSLENWRAAISEVRRLQ